MDTLDTAAMLQRFQERAKAVRTRNMPPIAGLERKAFVKQAELDYQDFAMIADSEISLDNGVLTIDLRPAICDATIRGVGISDHAKERETKVAMENISKSEHRTYDDIMEVQREKREALIEDEDRPSMLPIDGGKITPGMLDSKADLQALIDGAEMFRVVKTIKPIDANACPGLDLANYDDPIERIVPIQRVPTERISTPGFSLTHGYLV
jgi:hypothetical protein